MTNNFNSSMKTLFTKIALLLLVFFLVSCSNNQNNTSEIDNDEPIIRELNSNELKDIELYLIKNGHQNLVLSEIQNKDDVISKTVVFDSYIPISPMKCKKSQISIDCQYDNQKDLWKYGDINSFYEGIVAQPKVSISTNTRGVGLERIIVPFSWNYNIDFYEEEYNSELLNPNKTRKKEDFEHYSFKFQNDSTVYVNHFMSVNPMDPDYTTENEYEDYTIYHAFPNSDNQNNIGFVDIWKNDGSKRLILLLSNLNKEEQIEIFESIILDNYEVNEDYANINPNIIDYNEELFRIRLKYNMRMRGERNQGENVIRTANKGEEFPVYKVLNDGKFIWYCIGKDMWLGDDGTCIEFID